MSIARLLSTVKALPPTPMRPPGSPQLSTALENIIHRTFPSASSSSASSPAGRAMSPSEEAALQRMDRAISSISQSTALNQYPLTAKTLQPPHDPMYYKRMLDGVHRASEGKGRSWWKRFFQIRGEA